MVVTYQSGPWEKLIHEKNQMPKISWLCTLKWQPLRNAFVDGSLESFSVGISAGLKWQHLSNALVAVSGELWCWHFC